MKTNILERVILHLTPLSPVHVGTGEDYEPTNYVIEDHTLFAFDSVVANQVLNGTQRENLLKMVSAPVRRPEDMIKQIQNFFYEHRKLLAAASAHCIPVSPGVFELYRNRVGQSASRGNGGKNVINKLAIQRTFFNSYNQQPVIPGSSFKGAIRTALLDDVNDGNKLQPDEKRFLDDNRPYMKAKANEALQERLFNFRRNVDGRSKKLLQCDPMRLVSLADASYQTTELFGSEVRFAIDRKKKEVLKDGKLVQSQAEANNLYQLLECLSPLRYRSFQSSLTIQDLRGIDYNEKTPAKDLRWTMNDIAEACNKFYRQRFEEELKILKERRYLNPQWEKIAEASLNGNISKRLDSNKVFLLRVGRHSGAESVTLNGVRSIKILEGKGANGKQKSSYKPEAKTIWLAANTEKDRSDMLPFGWLLVEIQSADEPVQDWPELQSVCESHLTGTQAVLDRFAKQREEKELNRAMLETKRHEEEEQARQRAEEETRAAQEEAERQARIAAMTPEQREIEDFRKIFVTARDKGTYNASDSVFNEHRLKLFRAAIDWSDTNTKQQAAALLRESIKWSGWPGKKERKAEFRTWLESLERKP